MQTLTTGIDDWDLAIALLGMTDGWGNRIKANVSHRRAAFLGEDVEYLADTDDEEIQAVCDRTLMRARMLCESSQIQTYLGSVSSELVEPEDDQEEEAVRKPTKQAPQEVEEPKKVKRSFRGIAFAAGGLSLILGVWFLGVGRSGPRSSNARTRVSTSDFSTHQGSEAGGRTSEGDASHAGHRSASGVAASDGDVYIISGHDRKAIDEEPIRRGDVVETGENSRALVTLSEDFGRVEVEAESSLKLGEEGEVTGPPVLSLRVGNVWMLIKNPALEVHSPLASVTASSGTLYRFRVVLSSATTVSVERGTAWVQTKVGERELIVVGSGKSLRVDPRGSVDLTSIEEGGRPRWLPFFTLRACCKVHQAGVRS